MQTIEKAAKIRLPIKYKYFIWTSLGNKKGRPLDGLLFSHSMFNLAYAPDTIQKGTLQDKKCLSVSRLP